MLDAQRQELLELLVAAEPQSFPLSSAQRGLWFLDQMEPGSPTYILAYALRLSGRLDVPALERALGELLARHEVLRARFVLEDGEPVQVIAPRLAVPLPRVDLSGIEAADAAEEEVRRLGRAEARRAFSLATGPLLRTTLVRLRPDEHVALLAVHHVASDAWSMGLLLGEVAALYGAFSRGEPSPLPELPIQYPDYVLWQRELLSGESLARLVSFWRDALTGAPPLDLPTDRPRPAVQSSRVAGLAMSADLGERLRALCQAHGVTSFMALLAAFAALLARTAGQNDFLIGTPTANRRLSELEGLIGFFINTLALRVPLAGDPTFSDLLARVRALTLEAFAHQDLPVEAVVAELKPERDLSRAPLFQVLFQVQNAPPPALPIAADLTLASVPLGSYQAGDYDLVVSAVETPAGLAGSWVYNVDLFDPATVRRLQERFFRLLEGACAEPGRRVSELPLLSAAERWQLLGEWNRPEPAGAAETLCALVSTQAEETPDATALVWEEGSLSYRALWEQVERTAAALRGRGVGPGAVVGLSLERSPELIVGLLAVQRAGAAYLPLDPAYPEDRLRFMAEDSGARLVLTEERLRELAQEEGPTPGADDADLPAYVIYTSGSTGTPKGVVATQRPLARFTRTMAEILDLKPGDRFLQFPSFSFDASLVSICPTLASGATLVLHRNPTALSTAELLAYCAEKQVNFLDLPVAFWRQAVEEARLLPGEGFGGVPVKAFLTGGESLAREAVLGWAEHARRPGGTGAETLFLSSYGPTEATVTTAVFTVRAGEAESVRQANVPLGRQLPGVEVYLLDGAMTPVPLGAPGEVWVGGGGVTLGYLGRPALTAASFLPDPLSGRGGARLYRTGDRARYLADGTLEFLGRGDDQVKIRGFRVELGEIEAALVRHPAVAQAAVVAQTDGAARRLVAYLVAQDGALPPTDALRGHLRERLPDYMVPSLFVPLERLPLTPGGKVDRRALPRPEAGERVYSPPRGETAAALAVLWASLLGVERVGGEDDFFDLGGHSLLATQLISRVRATLGVDVPLRRLFEAPTLQAFAAAVTALRGQAHGAPPLVRRSPEGAVPLSFGQERLWFLDQWQPNLPTYNMPQAVRLEGLFDLRAMAGALTALAARHEALRTTFQVVAGRPEQRVAAPAPVPVALVDLGALPSAVREAEASRLSRDESARPFDLARGPLLRAGVVRMGPADHLLLATLHHIVSDGWSMGIFLREVGEAYQAFASGKAPLWPDLPVRYADFAAWQREWLQGDALAGQLAFWRSALGGDLAVLELPTDRPRQAQVSMSGARRGFTLPEPLAGRLAAVGRRYEATPFMVLFAAFDLLLSRLSGHVDVPVGTPVAGRTRRELEGLIGLFLNTLVIRGDLSGDPAFAELLARVRHASLDALTHQDLPFEKLVEELQPARTTHQTPLFQVMFVLQNTPPGTLPAGALRLTPLPAAAPTARFDLTVSLAPAGGGYAGTVEYRSDLFDPATIERWIDSFQTLVAALAESPEARLSALPHLSPAARVQAATEWNDTALDLGVPGCLHHPFLARAGRNPEAVAVAGSRESVTYRELVRRTEAIARGLAAKGVGEGTLVAILMQPSADRVAAVVAVVALGAAYVPLDPAYPEERREFMIADAGASLVLTDEVVAGWMPPFGPPVDGGKPVRSPGPEGLAYVIYTSGSTGKPKGVMIRHAAALNTVLDVNRRFGVGPADRVFAVSALAFDLSVYDLFGTLAAGGTIVLPDPSPTPDPAAWAEVMARHGVTVWDSAPALLDLLISSGVRLPPSLRLAMLSGDWIPVGLPDAIRRQVPGARVMSLGGATEGSIWSISYPVGDVPSHWSSIPYGRPLGNQTFHLLDRWGDPTPVGVTGQLHIGGTGVADGYWRRPELTAERYLPDPFSSTPGARLYWTGDLGRRLPDGTIEFLGRRDQQVKIRGHRIELGEIEATLAEHEAVAAAVLAAREDVPGEKRLVAYVVPTGGAAPQPAELSAHLRAHLPEHMIPTAWVTLPAVPLTANGKVDRRALPAPEAAPREVVPPRDSLEAQLAAIWRRLLGVEDLSVHDHFFELGGHSLLATRLVAAVRDEMGVELPLREVFDRPTLAGLALAVAERRVEHVGAGDLAGMLDELEGLSDAEIERLLAEDESGPEERG